MEYMDVDQIYEVPDTPDETIKARNCIKRGKFVPNHSLAKGLFDEGVRNRPAASGTQRHLLQTSKNPILSDKSDHHISSSSSSKIALPLQRTEKEKGICIEEFKKPSVPSSRCPSNAASAFEENGKDCLMVDSQPKVEKRSQRRLVRGGCISPLNVAKLTKSTEKLNIKSTDKATEKPVGVAVAPRSKLAGIEIRDFVSEPTESHRVRGKSVISQILQTKRTGGSSSSVGEEAGGWRNTRNRGKDTNPNPSVSAVPPLMHDVQPANARSKRQKHGPTSSTNGECSTSNSDDPELVCLGSSSKFRSTGATRVDPVVEIPEFSPQPRNDNHDSEIRARQLEADEMLAMELQEQLFNESLLFEAPAAEFDAEIASAIQQQERITPTRTQAPRPQRNNLISNLRAEARSQNPTVRRGTSNRVLTSTRTARAAPRFPGQPRTLSPAAGSGRGRGRRSNSSFPSREAFRDMDINTRIGVLEAQLEAFNQSFHHQRDFNENDYEMLLALDENNHRHGGATIDNINALPESKVQNESHQEVCAICLDTPEIGDTIRHLPCFHKFHKDCIDPWLKRKTSCPVCKSSIS
jgi:hypothetical protein